jgi:hypothetical protein
MAAAREAVPLVFKHQKLHKNSIAESNLASIHCSIILAGDAPFAGR